MADPAIVIATLAALIAILATCMSYSTFQFAKYVLKSQDKFAKEFWSQSVHQSEQNMKIWEALRSLSEQNLQLLQQHLAIVHSINHAHQSLFEKRPKQGKPN